jgi:hypothetical protein
MKELNELKILITLCVLSFIILFVVSVYAQANKVKCKPGNDGPQGSQGESGLTGNASAGASSYILGNTLNSTLLVPVDQSTVQRLPAVGIPWRTFENDGDSALFTFMFNIASPTTNVALQAGLFFTVSASFTDRPFRSKDPKQKIKLIWDRGGFNSNSAVGKIPNVIIQLTRNNSTSLVVTIVQGAQWLIVGGDVDRTSSNVIVTDLNFFSEDMFVLARADIPVSSAEKVVFYSSTVQFIK